MKDIIKYLTTKDVRHFRNTLGLITRLLNIYCNIYIGTGFMQDTTRENKLRLLMILAAIYPEKFDGEKGANLMKVGLFLFIPIFHFLFHLHEVNHPI